MALCYKYFPTGSHTEEEASLTQYTQVSAVLSINIVAHKPLI